MSTSRKDFNITRKLIHVKYDTKWGHGFTVGGETPALVLTVRRTSPADKAGLLRGDFILTITGNSVYTLRAEQVQKMLSNLTGKDLKLYVARPDPVPKNEQERRRALITLQTELNKEKEKKIDTSAFQSSYTNAMDDIGALLNDLRPMPVSRTPRDDKTGYGSSDEDGPPSKKSTRQRRNPSPLTQTASALGDGTLRFGHEEELESPDPSDDEDDDQMNDPLFDFTTQKTSGVCTVSSPSRRDFSLDDFTNIVQDINRDTLERMGKKNSAKKTLKMESTEVEYEPSFVHKKTTKPTSPATPPTSPTTVSQNTPISVTVTTVSQESKAEIVRLSPTLSDGNGPSLASMVSNGNTEEVDRAPVEPMYSKVNKTRKSPNKAAPTTVKPSPEHTVSDLPDLVVVEPKTKKSENIGSFSKTSKHHQRPSTASSEYDDFDALFPSTEDFFLPEPFNTDHLQPSSEPDPIIPMEDNHDDDPTYAVIKENVQTSSQSESTRSKPASQAPSPPGGTDKHKKPTSQAPPPPGGTDKHKKPTSQAPPPPGGTDKHKKPIFQAPPPPDAKKHPKPSSPPPPVPPHTEEMEMSPPPEPHYDVILARQPAKVAPKPPATSKTKKQSQETRNATPEANTSTKAKSDSKKSSQGKSGDRPSGKSVTQTKSSKTHSQPPPVAYDEVSGFHLQEDPNDPGYATVKSLGVSTNTTSRDLGYATVKEDVSRKKPDSSDPGYATVKEVDHHEKKPSFYDEVEYDDFSTFVPIQDQVEDQFLDQFLDQIEDQIQDRVHNQVRNQVRNQVQDRVQHQVRNRAQDQTKPVKHSQPPVQSQRHSSQNSKPSSGRSKSKKDNVSDLIVPLRDLELGEPQPEQPKKTRENLYDEIKDRKVSGPPPSLTESNPPNPSNRTTNTTTPTDDSSRVRGSRPPAHPPARQNQPKLASHPNTSTSPAQVKINVSSPQPAPLESFQVTTTSRQDHVGGDVSSDMSSLEKGTSSSKFLFWKKKRAISQKDKKNVSSDSGVMLKGYHITSDRDYSGEMYTLNQSGPSSKETSDVKSGPPVYRTSSPSSGLTQTSRSELEAKSQGQKSREKAVTSHDLKQRRRLSIQGHLELTCKTAEVSTEGLPLPIQEWTNPQVLTWLKQLNEFLYSSYHTLFQEHHITGRSLLRIQDYQLTQMGIDNQKHRSALTSSISRLKIYQAGQDLRQMS